ETIPRPNEGIRIDELLAQLARDRKSTRLNSSHVKISYAVFCLKKKKMISYLLVVEQHRTQIVIHALLKCQQENLYHEQNLTHISPSPHGTFPVCFLLPLELRRKLETGWYV